MHKDIAVKIQNVSKVYKLYNEPIDRLKESLHPLKKKYHKDFYALKNINLEIKKGEVLGIVGVNGAGKSTLLKIITGVLTPTTGKVQITGKLNAILELGSGLKPDMTGRENIKFNLQINGIEKDREKITEDIINFADIGEHIDQPIKTYSSGMKARLAFGIETSTDPDILIVDEVLAVGDVLFQRKCYNRIEKLFKDGKTVIFVSHSAQSVIEFCSHAILLYDREIILEDTPKKVTDFYQKLVFSKDHNKILNEIKGKKTSEIKLEVEKEIKVNNNFYLSNLKSDCIEYRNYDVDIYEIMILNSNNEKVNILQYSNTYTITFKVKFKKNYNDVRFGFTIVNVKGINIFGIRDIKDFNIISVTETIYLFKYTFDNILADDTYFINIGIKSLIGEERKFLNRKVNAYMFKSISDTKNQWGIFYQNNFSIVKEIKEIDAV